MGLLKSERCRAGLGGRVLEGSTRNVANPKSSHELEAGQPSQILGVPFRQPRVLGLLPDDGVLHDGIAEVIDHRRDGEDTSQPLVQAFFRRRLLRLGFIKEEGKTLEFKENTSSLPGIIKTVVSFANTAGGTIIIGIEDKTKLVVGLTDPLEDEMRIINKISDSITPQFRPNIEIQSYRKKALILIQVPYATGPYYFKKDNELIAYVRFGSTNRIADDDTLATMKGLSKNITFDESPCPRASIDELDWAVIQDIFASVNKSITKNKAKSIGIFSAQSETNHLSNGGVLLFGKNRSNYFPDAIIRCVRFSGLIRENSIDHIEVDRHLPMAIDEVLYFITKNTFTKTMIGKKSRINTPQYPTVAIREAIMKCNRAY